MILVCVKEILHHGSFRIGNKYEADNSFIFLIKDDDGNNWHPRSNDIGKYFISIEEWREIKLGELGI